VTAICCRSGWLPGSDSQVSRCGGLQGLLGKVPSRQDRSSRVRLLLRLLVLRLLRQRLLNPLHAGDGCFWRRLMRVAAHCRVRGRDTPPAHCRCRQRGGRWQTSRCLLPEQLHRPIIRRGNCCQQLALRPAPQALLAKGAGRGVC
jgi:hypothetical protein